MASIHGLVVESDLALGERIKEQLRQEGIEARVWTELPGLGVFGEERGPDLLVLGVPLHDEQASAIIQNIRARTNAPIFVVGGQTGVDGRISVLKAGADDVFEKPFDPRELAARASVVLRRAAPRDPAAAFQSQAAWSYGGLTIAPGRRRVFVDGEGVDLTATEFDLLRLFVSEGDQPLSRELILERLRGIELGIFDRSIDILVSRLRDKLRDDPRRPRFIRTVRGIGYQFIAGPSSRA